jgi:HD superfamily phosphohydrolase
MRDYRSENLSHDPLHGYIPFTADVPAPEVAERQLIDHPWVQRLRQIHQLQTAWYVYPTAEHSRFEHVLGVMHLASRAVDVLYDSLVESAPDVPSRAAVESLMRMAGLLHDVGHGPFGHFFDDHFLADYGWTHETLGARIIRDELGDLLRGLRRNPNGRLAEGEWVDPEQINFLITRPGPGDDASAQPLWLRLLRSLFSGLYTVDNLDFVLRDAYMSGYSTRAIDLDRGLTIHDRGLSTLVRFLAVRAELFRSIYFHRTVRAIDLTLADLFADSKQLLFPGNPAERLAEYLHLTEWSLLVDVARWPQSDDPQKRAVGARWARFLAREVRWKTACERTLVFGPGDAEQSSIFQRSQFVEQHLREQLPAELSDLPMRVDLARHIHRPGTHGAAAGQNFLYDSATDQIRPLADSELYRQLPVAYRLCWVYIEILEHSALLGAALDRLIGPGRADDKTNM